MSDKFDFQDGNGLVPAHKHPNGGGWVANTASVAESVYVGPKAQVSGLARVYGSAVVSRLFSVNRSDGYTFAVYRDAEKALRITAGCRDFTPEQAKEHWTRTRGGTLLGIESLAAVDYLCTVFAAWEAEESAS